MPLPCCPRLALYHLHSLPTPRVHVDRFHRSALTESLQQSPVTPERRRSIVYDEGHPAISATSDTSAASVVFEVSSGLVNVTTPLTVSPTGVYQRVQRGSLQPLPRTVRLDGSPSPKLVPQPHPSLPLDFNQPFLSTATASSGSQPSSSPPSSTPLHATTASTSTSPEATTTSGGSTCPQPSAREAMFPALPKSVTSPVSPRSTVPMGASASVRVRPTYGLGIDLSAGPRVVQFDRTDSGRGTFATTPTSGGSGGSGSSGSGVRRNPPSPHPSAGRFDFAEPGKEAVGVVVKPFFVCVWRLACGV